MKRHNILFIIIIIGIIGCTKSTDFLRDHIKTNVGSVPVSSNALLDMATNKAPGSYTAGTSFKTELQYFSENPITEINLYNKIGSNPKLKVLSLPHIPAYSRLKSADTVLIPYMIPVGTPVGTSIVLDYEIATNINLNIVRSITIKVK